MATGIGDPLQELLGFYSEKSLGGPYSETQVFRVTDIESTAVVSTFYPPMISIRPRIGYIKVLNPAR